MKAKKPLIKAILNQLDQVYPRRYDNHNLILEKHRNREEIIELLFYLKDEELVELRDWSSRTQKACGLISLRTMLSSFSVSILAINYC